MFKKREKELKEQEEHFVFALTNCTDWLIHWAKVYVDEQKAGRDTRRPEGLVNFWKGHLLETTGELTAFKAELDASGKAADRKFLGETRLKPVFEALSKLSDEQRKTPVEVFKAIEPILAKLRQEDNAALRQEDNAVKTKPNETAVPAKKAQKPPQP